MRAFKVFIFGLLYGWFFKIAFDRIYRGNEIDDGFLDAIGLRVDRGVGLQRRLQVRCHRDGELHRCAVGQFAQLEIGHVSPPFRATAQE